MATLYLRLDKRRSNAKGLYPIQLVIASGSSVSTINTGIAIRPEHWRGDADKAVTPKCPNAQAINSSLAAIYFKFGNALRDLELSGQAAGKSPSELRKMITSKPDDGGSVAIYPYFERYAASRRKKNSTDSYMYTLGVLKAYGGDSLTFETITKPWLKAFDRHLQDGGASANTRGIHLRNLRAVFNSAIDDNIVGLDKYPFRKFNIPSGSRGNEALTVEQLRQLVEYDSKSASKCMARDLFMLSFALCGVNLIDLYHLGRLHGGRMQFVRIKTEGKSSAPVSLFVQPEAQRLFDRYAGESHVLCFIERYADYDSFQNMIQKAIRAIAKELGIEGLTFYSARYTWATMADALGVAEKEISKGLGHVDTSVAGKYYIAYDWSKVDAANRRVLDHVFG